MVSDKRISELVELTTLAADDEFVVVDADANGTKRVTYDTLATEVREETTTLNLGDSTAISSLGADSWRLDASASSSGLLTSWERVDEPTSNYIGSGITHSSGTFNVPNTGIWLILGQFYIQVRDDSGDALAEVQLRVDGNEAARVNLTDTGGGNDIRSHTFMQFLGELTPSNDLTFEAFSVTSGLIIGGGASNFTSLVFIRLGDA